MKNFYFLFIIFLFTGCFSSKLYKIDDEFKNRKTYILTQDKWFSAPNDMFFNRHRKKVFIKWINEPDKTPELHLYMTNAIESYLEDDFYIKAGNEKFHLIFDTIDEREYHDPVDNEHIENIYEEKKDDKEDKKDSDKKRVLKTVVEHNSYVKHYKKVIAKVKLNDKIKKQLINSNDDVVLQFYLDKFPYRLTLNKWDIKKLKTLFSE